MLSLAMCLFLEEFVIIWLIQVDDNEDIKDVLNSNSKQEIAALGDSNMRNLKRGDIMQLERKGYFRCDVPYMRPAGHIVLYAIPEGRQNATKWRLFPLVSRFLTLFVVSYRHTPLFGIKHFHKFFWNRSWLSICFSWYALQLKKIYASVDIKFWSVAIYSVLCILDPTFLYNMPCLWSSVGSHDQRCLLRPIYE